jgi:hypothetical protein
MALRTFKLILKYAGFEQPIFVIYNLDPFIHCFLSFLFWEFSFLSSIIEFFKSLEQLAVP